LDSARALPVEVRDWDAARVCEPVERDAEWACGIARASVNALSALVVDNDAVGFRANGRAKETRDDEIKLKND
jgi:hypothetical protein